MQELNLEASVANIPAVTDFVNAILEELDCPIKAQLQIDVAIDELFSNIAYYAYPDGAGEATVGFDFDPSTGFAAITFTDHGVPFDPLWSADPDTTLGPEERAVGGLGIFLVKKTMDEVSYRYADGANRLRILKRIAPGSGAN